MVKRQMKKNKEAEDAAAAGVARSGRAKTKPKKVPDAKATLKVIDGGKSKGSDKAAEEQEDDTPKVKTPKSLARLVILLEQDWITQLYGDDVDPIAERMAYLHMIRAKAPFVGKFGDGLKADQMLATLRKEIGEDAGLYDLIANMTAAEIEAHDAGRYDELSAELRHALYLDATA
jgi:hypothetical protein